MIQKEEFVPDYKFKTDEELIDLFIKIEHRDERDNIFKLLIERTKDIDGKNKPSWKSRILMAAASFIRRTPHMKRDYDQDIIYNKILMNLFKSMKNYDPNKKKFESYFNALIFKTLLNLRRDFNVKKKRYIYDGDVRTHIYSTEDSLDEKIIYGNTEVDRHELIPSEIDLEQEIEKEELVRLIMKKCKKYLSGIAFEILLHSDMTQQLTNGELAKKYRCSCAKISSVKKRQIIPVIKIIRKEIKEELGVTTY